MTKSSAGGSAAAFEGVSYVAGMSASPLVIVVAVVAALAHKELPA
jgi:hypothetical protein